MEPMKTDHIFFLKDLLFILPDLHKLQSIQTVSS